MKTGHVSKAQIQCYPPYLTTQSHDPKIRQPWIHDHSLHVNSLSNWTTSPKQGLKKQVKSTVFVPVLSTRHTYKTRTGQTFPIMLHNSCRKINEWVGLYIAHLTEGLINHQWIIVLPLPLIIDINCVFAQTAPQVFPGPKITRLNNCEQHSRQTDEHLNKTISYTGRFLEWTRQTPERLKRGCVNLVFWSRFTLDT